MNPTQIHTKLKKVLDLLYWQQDHQTGIKEIETLQKKKKHVLWASSIFIFMGNEQAELCNQVLALMLILLWKKKKGPKVCAL